jgi:hypoxanthine phosphoribosyltransferase
MSYFSNALNHKHMARTSNIAKQICDILGMKPSHIVGRGISGVLALPPLAAAFDCEMAISRKETDSCHSSPDRIEYNWEGKPVSKVIIVDDFVETGNTILKILKHLERFDRCEVLGLICYDGWEMYSDAFNQTELKDKPFVGVNVPDNSIRVRNVTDEEFNRIKILADKERIPLTRTGEF